MPKIKKRKQQKRATQGVRWYSYAKELERICEDQKMTIDRLKKELENYAQLEVEEEDKPCEDCEEGTCQLIAHMGFPDPEDLGWER
jgi:hypothetical protein